MSYLSKKILVNFYLVVLILLSPSHCLKGKSFTCEKITACQCAFPVGEGIDLSKLSQFWIHSSIKNVSFYFQPCFNIPFPGSDECESGASMCMLDNSTKKFSLLGKVEEASFVSRSLTDDIYLKYVHKNITSQVLLKCDPTAITSTLIEDAGSTTNNYQMTLVSSKACLTRIDVAKILAEAAGEGPSLSAGSVLVIIFFTFSAIYLVAGAIILKLVKGAEGKELIPNYDFWSGLPGLVKDGVMFVCAGFTTAATYDRI